MTDSTLSTDVRIEYLFDEEYWQSVTEKESPDRWIQASIQVNNTFIYGGNDSGVRGLACANVLQLLESIKSVAAGERYVIEFEYGPTWLVVEPNGEKAINVVKCVTWEGTEDPDKRLDIDTSRTVAVQAWVEAVIDSAQEFHDTILERHPEFRERDIMEQIRTEIDSARKFLDSIEG